MRTFASAVFCTCLDVIHSSGAIIEVDGRSKRVLRLNPGTAEQSSLSGPSSWAWEAALRVCVSERACVSERVRLRLRACI